MLRSTYDNQRCAVAWSLEVVGERWTLLIVRDALLGATRFGEFRARLGITASVLAARLDRLVTAGVLERVPYHSQPTRYEYRLTASGKELALVVLSLMSWGDRHFTGHRVPPKAAFHDGCGGRVQPRLQCCLCHVEVPPDQIVIRSVRGRTPAHSGV